MKLLNFSVRPDSERPPVFDGWIGRQITPILAFDCSSCESAISISMDEFDSVRLDHKSARKLFAGLADALELTSPTDGRYSFRSYGYDYGEPLLGFHSCGQCERNHLVAVGETEPHNTHMVTTLWAVVGVA